MSMALNKGVSGAKRASYLAASPRELLVRVINASPHRASESVIQNAFERELANNRRCQDTINAWWFANNYNKLVNEEEAKARKPRIVTASTSSRPRQSERAATETAIAAVTATIRHNIAKIKLGDMMLPNGKTVKTCTFGEIRKMAPVVGDWLSSLGAKGKKDEIVGRVVSEVEMQDIYTAAN